MSSATLLKLTPIDFENFVFDLLMLKGMQNVRWRTPGADGGRDIEATEIYIDLSNTQVVRKWYIECKRYKSSVDWPTVFSKLSYAEAQGADYLLMCTSSKFTPAAISQMEAWNFRRGSVQIRFWPGHEIEHHSKPFFDLRSKYGIDPPTIPHGDKLGELSLAVAKSIQTYYGRLIFEDAAIDPMVSGAQAVALLMRQRLEDLERFGRARTSLVDIRSIRDFPVSSPSPCLMDWYAYVALLSYQYALSKEPVGIEILDDQSCQLTLSQRGAEQFCRYEEIFSAILFWGNIEWNIEAEILTLVQRAT